MMMPRKRQRGFSLIELMVAMTIGLIVLAGVGYLYVQSRQSFSSMDNVSRMQETARYALEIMSHDIRMAGYRGCASSTGKFINTVNSTDAAYNFGVPVNGYDASGAGWSPALPSGVGGLSGIKPGTDAIILRSAFGGGTTVTAQPGVSGLNDSSDLKVSTPNELAVGDIAIVTNCNAATVFQITGPTGCCATSNVVHNTGVGTPGNSTKALGENYAQNGGEIVKMESRAYFIRTGASKRPALWQQAGANAAQEIADGVENMQIQYGVDTDGDGVVDSYTPAGVGINWNQVVAVRISLLVVSPDDQIATSSQTYTYDGASVTAGDKKLRQVFTTTVSVRNRTQ